MLFLVGLIIGFAGCIALILGWDEWDRWQRSRRTRPRTLVYNRKTNRWEGKP